MDKIVVKEKVIEILNKVSKRLGFKEDHRSINYDWGFDRIVNSQINVFEQTNSFQIVISLSRRINPFETIWEEYSSLLGLPGEANISFNLTTLFCFPELVDQSYNLKGTGWMTFSADEKGFKEFEEVVEYVLSEKISTKSKELLNLKKLDQLINNKIELNDDLTTYVFNSNGIIFRRLALAKSAANPLYEEICDYHRSYFDQYKILANNQMQFCVPGKSPPCTAKGDYFIADQVWIKYDEFDEIENMIVIDTKLSESTTLTDGQKLAKNEAGKGNLAYKPVKTLTEDDLAITLPTKITQGTKIPIFEFYKLFGDGSKTFLDIKKIN